MMALSSTAHSNNALMYCGTANGVAAQKGAVAALVRLEEMIRFHEDHPMALLFCTSVECLHPTIPTDFLVCEPLLSI
jgi:hypothetical protein